MPRVLIDITKYETQQSAAFVELPIYDELWSPMTTWLDHARSQREVKKFSRYMTFWWWVREVAVFVDQHEHERLRAGLQGVGVFARGG